MINLTLNNWKLILSIIITTITGLVFLISGIAKLFIVKNFAYTVGYFLPFVSSYSFVIAIIVILLEIIFGAMLIFRIKLSFTTFFTAVLLMFFIGILVVGAATGNSVRCNCFGVLNLSFPAKSQILIDILLLNGIIAANFLKSKNILSTIKSNLLTWSISIAIIVLLEASLVKNVWKPNNNNKLIKNNLILSCIDL